MSLRKDEPRSAAEHLADRTNDSEATFEPPANVEYPHPEELTWERIDDED